MRKATYWIWRSTRHVTLAALAIAITCLAYAATPPPDVRHRLSMATAYTSLILLAVSLWIGPWNVLRRRPNPVSFDLRRDIGIWTGILAVLHTIIGLTVHLRGGPDNDTIGGILSRRLMISLAAGVGALVVGGAYLDVPHRSWF